MIPCLETRGMSTAHLLQETPAARGVAAIETGPRPLRPRARERFVGTVRDKLFRNDREYGQYGETGGGTDTSRLRDFVFAVEDEPHLPDDVFGRLRWGGQFIYISRDRLK